MAIKKVPSDAAFELGRSGFRFAIFQRRSLDTPSSCSVLLQGQMITPIRFEAARLV
jgi:hypothetical protein